MNIKDINWKKLLSSIAIPVVVGAISGFLTRNSMDKYSALKQPFLAPPGWLFPIVWTILYVLMGISFYFVVTSDSAESSEKKKATIIYAIQLILNFIWTPVFFILDSYL